jgi:hypothetical protein
MAHSCDTSVVSYLIDVISVGLKKYLTISCFWTIEEESSDTTKWDNLRLRLAMPSSIYPMVPSCRSIEPPAVFGILSLDWVLFVGGWLIDFIGCLVVMSHGD